LTFNYLDMKVVKKREEIKREINELKAKGLSVGFVPTMGALHQGHLSLVRRAGKENDRVVVSIFVNPTQFNNAEDLEKYPRDLATDLNLLSDEGCDLVFAPEVEEMYPDGEEKAAYDFGLLTGVMEGANRPGHFDGVATVVEKLFEAIPADRAYFGKKDYQQLLVIRSLVKQRNIDIEIVGCEIVREADGLAMSSRNRRLTAAQRARAPFIYSTLQKAASLAGQLSPVELKELVAKEINSVEEMELEYFEPADADTLQPVETFEKNKNVMGFIVVNLGSVRLIDNIRIF